MLSQRPWTPAASARRPALFVANLQQLPPLLVTMRDNAQRNGISSGAQRDEYGASVARRGASSTWLQVQSLLRLRQ